MPSTASATDPEALARLFGNADDLIPLWIAEPYVPLAPAITEALADRAAQGWYGYEQRPSAAIEAFGQWMQDRHSWDVASLQAIVSPSVGTTLGVLIEQLTEPGHGVILQPPVFTDFKPLVTAAGRKVVSNSLVLEAGHYRMDLDDLATRASDPATTLMILCNPHNPVGRVWTASELQAVADICADNGVAVVSDEIHADLALPGQRFEPFAKHRGAARWAAAHGPIKTFGLAGVSDTLLVTDHTDIAKAFEARSSQLHLTRNNVFGLRAFEAGYRHGGPWLDQLIDLTCRNLATLREGLASPLSLIEPEATYLAWLDLRGLGLEVPALAHWLADSAGLALSPGHWFGREGAGMARMTVAVGPEVISEATDRLNTAVTEMRAG